MTQGRVPPPQRPGELAAAARASGRARGRAVLAVLAALLVAFDVACLSVLGFLVVGQTLGYFALLGWAHVMAVVGVANAVVFVVVLAGLLRRWRRGHRRGHMVEIALVTTVAGALVLGHATVLGVQMAFVAVSDPSAWDVENLLPELLGWL